MYSGERVFVEFIEHEQSLSLRVAGCGFNWCGLVGVLAGDVSVA